MSPEPLQGILNVNKPAGLSSARVVAKVKRLLPRGTKIGHAGTLDPFATGVLLLLVGKATKLCERLMDQPKQYEATVKLGGTTPTDDPESPETPTPGAQPVSREQIEAALQQFVGPILQRPPAFSALKVGGRRAYDLARKGHDVELQPRTVNVYAIELLDYAWPLARIRIDCGRGTYIRAIARDLGEVLGVGGHLTALVRTRVGEYLIANGHALDQLDSGPIAGLLRPALPAGGGTDVTR
jgi:tRNA pseudouridine55 synthase